MGRSQPEFPLLAAAGLYAAPTTGNGNCLFHALSDQLYGNQSRHQEIRARVTDYMREHDWEYKPFLSVNSGGGTRRNPKRKNAGAFSTPHNSAPPTEEEINAVFEAHLAEMSKGGTYGDNMEINAFSNAYGVDVKIWRYDGPCWLSTAKENTHDGQALHIALHSYEHYSSVRNNDGPHSGLPEVKDPEKQDSTSRGSRRVSVPAFELAPWKITAVQKSLPYHMETSAIQRVLMICRGDIDEAVSYILEHEDDSPPSTPGSSSIEREQDDVDEAEFSGQRKKQDRRQSRATKAKLALELAHRPKAATKSRPASRQASRTRGSSAAPEDKPEGEDRVSSDAVSDSEDPIESQPQTVAVRQIKKTQAKSLSRSNSKSREPKSKKPPPNPAKPKVSASVAKEMKKRAQKAASKERKQSMSAAKAPSGKPVSTKESKRESPPTSDFSSLLI